jgi:hypothetical protein
MKKGFRIFLNIIFFILFNTSLFSFNSISKVTNDIELNEQDHLPVSSDQITITSDIDHFFIFHNKSNSSIPNFVSVKLRSEKIFALLFFANQNLVEIYLKRKVNIKISFLDKINLIFKKSDIIFPFHSFY